MADPVEASVKKSQQKEKKKKSSLKSEGKTGLLKTVEPPTVTEEDECIIVNLLEPENSPIIDAEEKTYESNNDATKEIIDHVEKKEDFFPLETTPIVGQEFIANATMPTECDLHTTITAEIAMISEIPTVPKITTLQEVATVSEITTEPELCRDLGYEEGQLEEVPSLPRARTRSPSSPYIIPPPTTSTDVLLEIDDEKLIELKEAFELFDMDRDGHIDHKDLKGTLISLGQDVTDLEVRKMLSEATYPLDFDAFVMLLGYRSMELDSEETLVEALAQWDQERTGFISEKRIRHDLMTWGDRFTEREVDMALDEAPIEQRKGRTMIDYIKFCKILCGLRKARNVVQN